MTPLFVIGVTLGSVVLERRRTDARSDTRFAEGRPLRPLIASLSALAAYAVLRLWADVGWPESGGLARMWWAGVPAVALYARRLVWPVALSPVTHLGWPPPLHWEAVFILAGGLAVLLRSGGRMAAAGLVLAALCFAPSVTGLAASGLLADRYLYLPMGGLALALAAGLEGRRAAPAVSVAVLLVGTALSSWQIPAWRDDDTLWSTVLAVQPSPYAAAAYAGFLGANGRFDEAAHWNHEATLPPKPFPGACDAVTDLHLRRGDPKTAVAEGTRALAAGCRPTAELLAPLGLAQALTGAWDDAVRTVAKVGDADPTGRAVLVTVADAARRGDYSMFERATSGADADARAAMAAQVAGILRTGGEEDAAQAILARYPAGAGR